MGDGGRACGEMTGSNPASREAEGWRVGGAAVERMIWRGGNRCGLGLVSTGGDGVPAVRVRLSEVCLAR